MWPPEIGREKLFAFIENEKEKEKGLVGWLRRRVMVGFTMRLSEPVLRHLARR